MKARTAAEVLLTTCSNCKPEEKLLFVTDPTSFAVAKKMWDATGNYPNRTLIMMNERTMHGQDPASNVAAAMRESDVIFGCTKFSLFHSQARRDAVANGARFVNMADYRPEMMEQGGLYGDFEAMGNVCRHVAQLLTGRHTCHITTKRGTDLTCSIEGRAPYPQFGRSLDAGVSSSPPDVECATCAVEGTANGVVYIDGSIPHPQLGLITDELRLRIQDGKIVEISGGPQAALYEEILQNFHDPNVFCIGEIGLGLNAMCQLNGSMLEDEGCGGTAHLACGDNTGFGGVTKSPYHMDMIFREPTIYADDVPVLIDGKVAE